MGFVTASALIQLVGLIQTQEFSGNSWAMKKLNDIPAEKLRAESRFLGIQMKSIEALNSWEIKYSAFFSAKVYSF